MYCFILLSSNFLKHHDRACVSRSARTFLAPTVYRDLSAKSIIEDVEDSLRRLHTDHLDVLYTHWQTPDFGIYHWKRRWKP